VIALNESRLKRLLSHYVRYDHQDRGHLGVHKETPDGRICPADPTLFFPVRDWVDCITVTTELREVLVN
jgi:hypothetical protein